MDGMQQCPVCLQHHIHQPEKLLFCSLHPGLQVTDFGPDLSSAPADAANGGGITGSVTMGVPSICLTKLSP